MKLVKTNYLQNIYHSLSYSDAKGSDGVVCQDLLVCDGHSKWAKILLARVWPVFLTFDLVPLLEVGEHDYYGWSLLPYQTPEVNHSPWYRTCIVTVTCM